MELWTFLWLMLFLKIPIVGLFLIVRWAVRQTPEPAEGPGGGIGGRDPTRPRHPHRPHTRLPRHPRRGPHHGAGAPLSPPRVRTVLAARSRTGRV